MYALKQSYQNLWQGCKRGPKLDFTLMPPYMPKLIDSYCESKWLQGSLCPSLPSLDRPVSKSQAINGNAWAWQAADEHIKESKLVLNVRPITAGLRAHKISTTGSLSYFNILQFGVLIEMDLLAFLQSPT